MTVATPEKWEGPFPDRPDLYPALTKKTRPYGVQWLIGRHEMIRGALDRGDIATASMLADAILEDLGWL